MSEIKINQSTICGVEPDAPIVENENGGKQSDTPYGFHLLPISALFDAAKVAKYGADKYGETFSNRNYTKIPTIEHLNHAIQHIYAFLAGDTQDDHLGHAIVRLMFAYDCNEKATENTKYCGKSSGCSDHATISAQTVFPNERYPLITPTGACDPPGWNETR